MKIIKEDDTGLIKLWNDKVDIEEEAIKQIKNCSRLPFVFKHLAIMPDAHAGYGSTVGSVIPTHKAIIPAAVGVDIGCGMIAAQTNLTAEDLPDDLRKIRLEIEETIPHGRTDNGGINDKGAWKDINSIPAYIVLSFEELSKDLQKIKEKAADKYIDRASEKAYKHLGTLGTGNHFIEICLDESNKVWIMLHSGSRGIGNSLGNFYIKKAKEEMERWMINVPDKDLAYLPEGSQYFDDYIEAVHWAQKFAEINRAAMFELTLKAVSKALGRNIFVLKEAVNCHHNYVQKENHFNQNIWVTRKGAVSAREGQLGIIPGSMGAKSFIVRGLGNKESFCSCSHGAGRTMSRTQAKKTFSLEDHAKATQGVECRKDLEVLDETPMAYKDIDAVMESQKDLVEIVHTLKQVVCVKG